MLLQRSLITQLSLIPIIIFVSLQDAITVTQNQATLDFPDAISFHLEAGSPAEIDSVELEVRTDALACGQSATRIVPDDFQPGQSISVDWTWELRRTGAVPPGATVSWRWVIGAGAETYTTPEEQLVIADESRQWEEIKSDQVILYWYEGSDAFAQTLLDAGQNTVDSLEEDLDTVVDTPIRMYVYADPEDMQQATLFAPDWSGGLAFSDYGALLLAIAPAEEEDGQRATRHEVNHIVVGRYSYSCVNSTPGWFAEGYAQISEGETDPYHADLLSEAVESNTLLSVRELGQIFSNDPDLARLSYAQSQSLVSFLIESYGQDKIPLLLDQFKKGTSEDRALQEVYSMERDELEAAWREWVGAEPLEAASDLEPATQTPYPTFVPMDEPPQAVAEIRPTPDYLVTPVPESADVPAAEPQAMSDETLGAVIVGGMIVTLCLGVLFVGAVIVLILIVKSRLRPTASFE